MKPLKNRLTCAFVRLSLFQLATPCLWITVGRKNRRGFAPRDGGRERNGHIHGIR